MNIDQRDTRAAYDGKASCNSVEYATAFLHPNWLYSPAMWKDSEANARNFSLQISLRWPTHIIYSVDKTKLSRNTPTDSAPQFLYKTYPLYLYCLWHVIKRSISYCEAYPVKSCWKESKISDTNWLIYLFVTFDQNLLEFMLNISETKRDLWNSKREFFYSCSLCEMA